MGDHAGFGTGLDAVGQAVVGSGVGIEQAVERRIEIVFRAFVQQLFDECGELRFPEAVFELAAGFSQAGRQPPQFGGVGRSALTGG